MERLRENELHPRPALLMKTMGAARVAARSYELRQPPAPPLARRGSKRKAYVLAAVATALLAIAAAVLLVR